MSFTWEHVLYRLYDEGGTLLYVGITNSITTRFTAHAKTQPWWSEVAGCRVEFYPDRAALERAELDAIRFDRPRYNVRGSAIPRPQPVPARHRVRLEQKLELGIPRKELPLRQRVSDDEWAWIHNLPPYQHTGGDDCGCGCTLESPPCAPKTATEVWYGCTCRSEDEHLGRLIS
jgi:hypothetical protein